MADGKVENQKQVSHFPTARFSPSLKTKDLLGFQPRSYRLPVISQGKNSCPRMEKYLTPISRGKVNRT
jgi:hypothetical protein